jgi:phosphatidylinositol glycan class A protein
MGHKVVVVTHGYDDESGNGSGRRRRGVRYLPGPIKVYYCPIAVMTDQDAMPTFTATLPLMRWIFVRERIDVVHAHQATSTLANESLAYASALGLASVYTDHSLFGFSDVASLALNRVLQVTLATADAAVAVSHTCRDNLVLRARLAEAGGEEEGAADEGDGGNNAGSPARTSPLRKRGRRRIVAVIPNAVDPSQFTPVVRDAPSPSPRSGAGRRRIVVVVLSRLVYRKGADLLSAVIPAVCSRVPFADFVVGGDGNRALQVREAVERHGLQGRVRMVGAVPRGRVRDVLASGHVFLNCSLTESFCIALLEAACAGLLSVSTRVGGVPEVLPDDLILLSDPTAPALAESVERAIYRQRDRPLDPARTHRRVAAMYSWGRVARETASVYERVLESRRRGQEREEEEERQKETGDEGLVLLRRRRGRGGPDLCERLELYREALGGRIGVATLVVWTLAVALELWVRAVEWAQPEHEIDVVPDLALGPHEGGDEDCNPERTTDEAADLVGWEKRDADGTTPVLPAVQD